MARDFGRILASIWSDPDFLAMAQAPQRFYLFLVTQPNLSYAGVLPVTARRWAKSANDLTPAEVLDLLDELAAHRFVVWDPDTEEVLVRTLLRHDKIYRQPNVMLKAVSDASEIVSTRLRLALLRELDRLPLEEVSDTPPTKGGPTARQVVGECIDTLRRTLFGTDDRRAGTLSGRVPGALSGTGSDPSGTKSTGDPAQDQNYAPLAHRDSALAQNEDHDAHHDAASNTHDAAGDADQSAAGLWEESQVSESEGTLPEWVAGRVPESLHAGARAHHARFPIPLVPSPNPENLCSPEVSDGASARIKFTPKRADFEAFWRAWPRKVGKVKAEKVFTTAVRSGTNPAAIIAAAESFAERHRLAKTEKTLIPHPTTWLNRGSWDDDLDDAVPLPPGSTPTSQPPSYGQPSPASAPDCRWCDDGWYERTDGRMDRCTHTDTPPAGHPAAEPARSAS